MSFVYMASYKYTNINILQLNKANVYQASFEFINHIELSASKLTTEMENTQQLSAIRTQTEMPWESHKALWECSTA